MRIHDPTTGKQIIRKRLRRHDVHGNAREFTFCCYHGYRFFSRDRTRQWFIDALADAHAKHPFDLWAFVIMPEHIHLLVYPREPGMKMGPLMGQIKEKVGRQAVEFLTQHAPDWLPRITVREGKRTRRRFWQPGGGFDRNGVEFKTIHHMINYIHDNPVRRGLVERPEDWYWSSARWYRGLHPVPIEIDRTIPKFYSIS
jgi:putative transposase